MKIKGITTSESLQRLLAWFLIFLFVYTAVSKLLEFGKFRLQLGQSPLLTAYADTVAWMVPGLELLLAVMLCFAPTRRPALYGSFLLMVMFTSYIVIILNYADFVPCSCGGVLEDLSWSQHIIFNSFFILLTVVAILVFGNTKSQLFKRSIWLISLAALGSLSMILLFLGSENQVHRNNGFTRRYPHHPLLQKNTIDLEYNSFYIAGITLDSIYLGNYTAPLILTAIDRKFTGSSKSKIHIRDDHGYRFKAIHLQVLGDKLYVGDGKVPVILRGELCSRNVREIMYNRAYFDQMAVLPSNDFAIRTTRSTNGELTLGKLNIGDTVSVSLQDKLLKKQRDGIFDLDGFLLYSNSLDAIVYTYRYRNSYLMMNKDLEFLREGKLIDTISEAKLDILYLTSPGERKLGPKTVTVTKNAALFKKYLFAQSPNLGKYESRDMLGQASIIDVYDLRKNTYVFSFYLYHHRDEKAREFLVDGNQLFALMGRYLVSFQLNPNSFSPEEFKNISGRYQDQDRKPETE